MYILEHVLPDFTIYYEYVIIFTSILLILITAYAIYEMIKIKDINKKIRYSNDKLNNILHATKSGLFEWNYEKNQLTINPTFSSILNIVYDDQERFEFNDWLKLVDLEDQYNFEKEFNDLSSFKKDFISLDFRIQNNVGNLVWIHCYATRMDRLKHSENQIVGIISNQTHIKESKRDMEHINYLLNYFVENNSAGVAIFDKEMNYLYVSNVYKTQFNLTDDIIGKNHYKTFPDIPQKFKDAHQRTLRGETLSESRDTFIRSNGEINYTNWQTKPWYDKNGLVGGIMVYSELITDQVLKEMRLEYISKYDKLTGVLNRSYFIETLAKIDIEDNLSIGLIILDLNGLKLINDALGYDNGDIIIKMVADALKKHTEQFGEVFKTGGDEFTFIKLKSNEKEIKSLMKKMHEVIESLEYKHIKLSAAIGFALKTEKESKIEDILRLAETNMLSSKALDSMSLRNHAIKGIIETLNDKYEIEKSHSDRVQKLCTLMGKALNLNKEEMNELSAASILHDIGKISIPDSILMKPGKLTEEEYNIMKTHTEKGYHILKSAEGFANLAKYALTHHEKFDGSGYPNGLKGEEIPYFSRIICICDAYEAMTADRPYRKAQTKAYALEQLKMYRASQFDPNLVDIFIEKVIPLDK
ncbi:Cyclic di-GMP phosphodiesterase response regulator RpfG [Acholeplasma oculi]|uniref:Diguanylate cyclase with PAS sensor n=1 Tax=Acholeplasma oculi TaxID=35623 RepID=A0A061AGU4_9MOLU|nr:HD domain-containing phosphohydrolase [Acholeplasma oculi]CDR30791.1 Diguanylate cyclase with PAS sensor [Acholeplasma oculi]SKC34999.1 diguanylate cyclase (GGDEF) domain-containing protein [Acholeplasma oculi]SUT89750.1 Cyclic di-GMP phosphodiesterase response regulator RpfG [Acholeplasma oculi]